jgi:nitrate/nitrite transporter NarK
MRKWLVLLLVWAVLYALAKINTPARRKKHPRLKRIDQTLNVVVWVLLAGYLVAFGSWLVGQISR